MGLRGAPSAGMPPIHLDDRVKEYQVRKASSIILKYSNCRQTDTHLPKRPAEPPRKQCLCCKRNDQEGPVRGSYSTQTYYSPPRPPDLVWLLLLKLCTLSPTAPALILNQLPRSCRGKGASPIRCVHPILPSCCSGG
jgi:hypothetical protein